MDEFSLLRRRLLLAGAGAALGLAACASAPYRLRHDPFRLGVASGSPTQDGVVLWTRLMPEQGTDALDAPSIPVRWQIADDERFSRVVREGQATADPALAHAVHVEAQGLAADRWYFYRFLAGDAVSPVGRTRTLPAAGAEGGALRVGYASCQRWEHGHFAAWRHMRADAPDLVLFLGDYIYEYPAWPGAVRSPGLQWTTTLHDYRARYALYKSDDDLRAMHAACPWVMTWDDHEVQNDYAGLRQGDGPAPPGTFAQRRAAAYQAWYEHMPVRAAVLIRALDGLAQGAEMRIYGQLRWGRLAQLCLLDTRQYRDAQACTPRGRFGGGMVVPADCAHWNDPARSMLGGAQEAWLDAQMAQEGAAWSVIGQSTLFGPAFIPPKPATPHWNEGWDGYPAARERALAALRRRAGRVVMLGGDVHEHWAGHIRDDYTRPGSAPLGVEFCTTSISSRPSTPERAAKQLPHAPHYVFADGRHRGYSLAEFTPRSLRVKLQALDDVTRADSGVRTLASFSVEAGRAVLERA